MAASGILESFVALSLVTSGAFLSTSVAETMGKLDRGAKAKHAAKSLLSEKLVTLNQVSTHELDAVCASSIADQLTPQVQNLGLNTWIPREGLETQILIESCEPLVGGNLTRIRVKALVRISGQSTLLSNQVQEARLLR